MGARSAPTVAAAAALLLVAACGGGDGGDHRRAPAPPAREVLPDLIQTVPAAISVVTRDGRERLVFLSAVENLGPGALVIVGRRADTTAPEMATRQIVRRADGSTAAYPLRTGLRFVVAETHRHWHLLGFERYDLLTPDGEPVGRDQKTGFCLGDRYDRSKGKRLPGEPKRAVFMHECGRGQPKRLGIREGLSPGFGDDYVPLLEGQYIDVTGLPARRYLLVHRVNAGRELREASYDNNAASALVRLRRSGGTTTVAVLARCPGSNRCG
jgi:hypothetical protein